MQMRRDSRFASVICLTVVCAWICGAGCAPGLSSRDARTVEAGLLHHSKLQFCAADLSESQGSIASSGSSAVELSPPPPEEEAAPEEPAGSATAMTLADVLHYTLHHHPGLSVRKHEVQIAQSQLMTAGLLPNPHLVMDTETELDGGSETQLTTRVTMELPTGPKRRLRTAVAQAAVQESQQALCIEIKAVLTVAAEAAVEVLYWQEASALQGRLRALAVQNAELQKERFRIAAVPYRNMILADLALADASLSERSIRANLQQAQVRLAQAMGMTGPCLPAMQGELAVDRLPPSCLNDLLAEARCAAPEMAQIRAAIARSREQLALERWNAVPDVTVGPRFQDSFSSKPDQLGARIAVDVPLFDRNQGNIAGESAQLQTECARLRLAEITALADAAALYVELQAVEENLDYYDVHLLPLVRQTELALDEALEGREISAAELVTLLEQFGKVRMDHLELRRQHNLLRTRLEILLERRLADSP